MPGISFEETSMPGLLRVTPQLSKDERGYFRKFFIAEIFAAANLSVEFAEEYISESKRGVLRGMHFQLPPHEHDKLVFCVDGSVLDVILDLRRGSPMFGRTLSFELTGPDGFGLYIPVGCAHGFYTLSDSASMLYKVTSAYAPAQDTGILWSSVNAAWPNPRPVTSGRDEAFVSLENFSTPFEYKERSHG